MGIGTKKKTWSGISGEIMFHLEQLHMTCLKRTQETSQETEHNLLPSEGARQSFQETGHGCEHTQVEAGDAGEPADCQCRPAPPVSSQQ